MCFDSVERGLQGRHRPYTVQRCESRNFSDFEFDGATVEIVGLLLTELI